MLSSASVYYISKCYLNLPLRRGERSYIFSHSHSNFVLCRLFLLQLVLQIKRPHQLQNFCSSPELIHFAAQIPSKLFFFFLSFSDRREVSVHLAELLEVSTTLSSLLVLFHACHLIPALQAEGFTRRNLFLRLDEMQTAGLGSGCLLLLKLTQLALLEASYGSHILYLLHLLSCAEP